jgi:serine/threonine-protein kinase
MARLPQPSDVIAGKYQVERVLGQGGMGIVYVVKHAITGKRLALKCLLPELLTNPDLVERFVREAQAAGRIQSRHVVDVFDVGRDGDVLFIVMELLQGKPLSELLYDERLTLEEALTILVRSMEGVAAAHAHGIVHRDLKPDNIFVCYGSSGRLDDPRVLDFGISKVEDAEASSLTRSGVAMGTPYYMALEQLSGVRDVDARVDVYAMGVILYEAIAGTPPHVADSIAALAIRLLTTDPVHLTTLRPDLPPGLADVIMRAISREREKRYQSMEALIEAVRPFVPRGATLVLPEGQGRLLRTPRATQRGAASVIASVPSAAALGQADTSLRPQDFPLPRDRTPVSVPRPAVTQAGLGHRSTKLPLLAASALGALVAAGGAWLTVSHRPSDPPQVAPPPAAELRHAAEGVAPAAPGQARGEASSPVPAAAVGVAAPVANAVAPRPLQGPDAGAAPQPEAAQIAANPAAVVAPEPGTRMLPGRLPRRGKAGDLAEIPEKTPKPVQDSPVAPGPVQAPLRHGVTVTGRAGTLGSDEF